VSEVVLEHWEDVARDRNCSATGVVFGCFSTVLPAIVVVRVTTIETGAPEYVYVSPAPTRAAQHGGAGTRREQHRDLEVLGHGLGRASTSAVLTTGRSGLLYGSALHLAGLRAITSSVSAVRRIDERSR